MIRHCPSLRRREHVPNPLEQTIAATVGLWLLLLTMRS
jgi:hypothetical protein